MRRSHSFLCLCSVVLFTAAGLAAQLPAATAAKIDEIATKALTESGAPSLSLAIVQNEKVAYEKAYGKARLDPAMDAKPEMRYSIGSVSKQFLAAAILMLVQDGKLSLDDRVSQYLPNLTRAGDVTIRQLLTHFSGLPEDLDLTRPWQGRDTALQMAYAEKLVNPPGSRLLYSDTDFIVLGALVERVSGMSLDQYCRQHIFAPLGMTQTRFLPPPSWLMKVAPTQFDEQDHMLRGVVHDPTARRMGGVAGHAGVFSTADDLSRFAQFLLTGGPVLSPLMIEKMTTPEQPPTAPVLRGFGWDIDSPFSSNRGDLLPVGSFGHTGFTGTSLWVDPTTRTFIVLLTNAVHPRGKGTAVALRSKIATAVAAELALSVTEKDELRWKSLTGYNETQTAARRVAVRNGSVRTGIDVLEAHDFGQLRAKEGKKRIGLLTNQTGTDSQGRRTIDVLAQAPGISLDAIFSPEHGVTGTLDTTDIANSKDAATGIPVYSVYGATDVARRPSAEILRNFDAVVVDIQDAGARFYTYETTLGYFLEAAAKAGIEIIVLDRPNPITGSFVQGPVADPDKESFTNYFALPVRHGMTMGELAKLFNSERGINARLSVIPMEGWMRGDWYDSTGLAWINPSPNLRSLTEAALYPGVALVEGTNVSVGRGTDTPFELLGAPWIKARELAQYLNARNISGVRFVAVSFTPSASNYSGQKCEGVNILLTERNAFDAPELGMELAVALHKLYPEQFHLQRMIDLLANQSLYDAIAAGEDPRRIAADWQERLGTFQQMRQKYLIYK